MFSGSNFLNDQQRLRDTIRLALQSSIAAVLTYLVMRSMNLPEMFIGVLSAVIVIQPTVGNALLEGRDRFLSTLVGSALGLACFMLIPNHYGTLVALSVSVLVLHLVAGFKPEWRYGVVAAIALSLGSENDAWQAATDRSIALGLGVSIGLVVNFVVWPDLAGRRARRHMKLALNAAVQRLGLSVEDAQSESARDQSEYQRQFHINLNAARDAAESAFGDTEQLLDQIQHTERLYNSVLILNRISENTNEANRGDPEFREDVMRCRQIAEEVVESLQNGESGQNEAIETFWNILERLREHAAGSAGDARGHVLQNAFVFGLGEIGGNLEGLCNAFSAN